MPNAKKKSRRRSGTATKSARRATSDALDLGSSLPPIEIPDDAAALSGDDARAALLAADGEGAAGNAQEVDHAQVTPAADDDAGDIEATPETALSDSAERTRDRSAPPAKPAPSSAATPLSKPPRAASLTGKQYQGLKVPQLRTALAMRDNELAELRAKLQDAAPVMAQATNEAMELACAETADTIANIAALFFGKSALITPAQKEKLGRVWAPAITPYMGRAAAHAPLLGAITATAGIVFEKYWAIQVEREQAKLDAAEPVDVSIVA